MRKKLFIGILFLISILIQSCDPTYSVSINNQTDSEITVQAKKTVRFWNDSITQIELTKKAEKDWIEFKIKPKSSIGCGMTIGGLKNDLPFSKLIIITESDTTKAESVNQVMELFDKTLFGNLETPYVLTIE